MSVSSITRRGHARSTRAILFLTWVLAARAATAYAAAHLTPGNTADLPIDSAHPAALILQVGRNQPADLIVAQDEPSLELRITSEDGSEIKTATAGYAGVFLLSLPPSDSATLTLIATAPAPVSTAASVTVSLELSQAGKADFTGQSRAEQMFLQAQVLRREPNANSVKKAIVLLEEARARWREAHSRSGEAVALIAEGDAWFQLSGYSDAHRLYSLAQQLVQPDSLLEESRLNAEACVDLELWRRETALQSATRALAISRKVRDGRGEADALANVAIANWLLSRKDAAAGLTQSLDVARSHENRLAEARLLTVQAWQERDAGRRGAAIGLMDRSAQLFQETGRNVDALGEMLDIASIDSSRGNVYSAIVRHVRLANLFHQAGSLFNEANADNNIGLDYMAVNRPRNALPYFRDARRLFTTTGNAWASQTSLGLTCETEISLKLFQAAVPDCEESRRISIAFQSPPYMALADSRLGKLAEARGQVGIAASYYRRAAELNSRAGYTRGEASAVMSLALLQQRAGSAAALHLFQKALELGQQAEDPAATLEAKYQIARVDAAAGRLDQAQHLLDDATALSESTRDQLRSEAMRSSYFADVRKCYDLYVDVLMRRSAADSSGRFKLQALQKSESARARTLFDALSPEAVRSRTQMSGNANLQRLRAALDERYENRLSLILGDEKHRDLDANADEIHRLAMEYDQAVALAGEEATPAAVAPAPISAAALVRASSDSVILEYHLAETRSYLWRIDHGEIDAFTLPSRDVIGAAVRKWRDLAAARQRRPQESFTAYRARVEAADRALPTVGAKLSCMLLPGLRFSQGTRLTVIADGSLEGFPFAALPEDGCDGVKSAPLIARHEIANAPSLRILTAAKTAPAADYKMQIAILADPVFSAHDARLTGAARATDTIASSPSPLQELLRDAGFGAELPRLYATRKEAESIAALAPPGSALLALDFQANLKTALALPLSHYRIWHFATHGLLDKRSPDLSGLVFSLVDSEGRPTPGYLNLQDVFDLSIDPELVVLSACDSGLGEQVEGEGAIGLSYAFLHAGAKKVVSTLWSVDDNASSELMTEFYRGLLRDRLSPAAALRKAQIAMLSRNRVSQPFYWAGYLLMRD